jgi:molybdenum cofactor cytidylyltransferase
LNNVAQPSSIGIIILAAGGSTRMGSPKQLLPFRERSLLRHAALTAIESGCRPVVVVLGAESARMEAEVADLPLVIAHNARWAEGMSTSIRAGVEKLTGANEKLEALILMLCDQPLVSAAFIKRLVSAYSETAKALIVSEYGGTLGVPALFDQTYFGRLCGLVGPWGAKQLLMEHAHEALRLASPDALLDIDTREDYRYLQEHSSG